METVTRKREAGNKAVAAIPALIVLCLMVVIPFFLSLTVAFKEYTPPRGISGSPWVGFANFSKLLGNYYTPRTILNTLFINGPALVLGTAYVFVLNLGIAAIKNKWLKGAVTSVVLLPALLPSANLVGALSQTGFLTSTSLYPLSAILNEVFCVAPLAVVAGMFACLNGFDMKKVWLVSLGYAAVRLMLFFTSDINYANASLNPLIYAAGDVMDTYSSRTALATMGYGDTSAMYILKILLGLLPAALGAWVFSVLSKSAAKSGPAPARSFAAPIAVLAILPLALFAFIAVKSVPGASPLQSPLLGSAILNSVVLMVVGSLFVTALSASLSYGLTSGSKAVFAALALFLLLSGNTLGPYLMLRSLGLFNTRLAVILAYAPYACLGAFLLYFAAGGKRHHSPGRFFKSSLPALVVMLGVCAARIYGGHFETMVYLSRREFMPLSLFLREMALQQSVQGGTRVSTIYLMLVPVVIALAGLWTGLAMAKKES